MTKVLYTLKERTVVDKIPFELSEFISIMKEIRPKRIFNTMYSEKTHLYEVLENQEEGIKYTCHSWADKTPKNISFKDFYRQLRLGGLENIVLE